MFKEIIKDPKLLATAGMTIVAIALIWALVQSNTMFSNSTQDMNEALRENTKATAESVEASRSLQSVILKAINNDRTQALNIETLSKGRLK